jgi:dipeptidyl aminopeptidase/acylaminoacyl peptidase
VSTFRDFRPSQRLAETVSISEHDRIAFVDDTTGVFSISLMSPDDRAPRPIATDAGLTVKEVAWSPDGRRLIFAADHDGDEQFALYVVDVTTAAVTALSDAPDVQHRLGNQPVSWDGRFLAYTANDRDQTAQDVSVRDLESGATRRLYEGCGLTKSGYWSPDNAYLTVSDWLEPFANHNLYVVSAAGGSARKLNDSGRGTYWLGPWLPDGSAFFVRSNRGRDFTGLALVDAQTGSLDWIDTPDWDIEEMAVSGDASTLVWLVNVSGATEIRGRDINSGAEVAYAPIPTGVVEALTVAFDGSAVYVVMSTPSDPTNLARVTATGFEWLTSYRPAATTAAIVPELVSITSSTGDPIDAWLYRPAHVEGLAGMVVSIHGGPTYQEGPSYVYDGLYQYLLSRGLGVIAPNIHGSTGYGSAFSEKIYRDWGGIDLADMACVHAYVRDQDWVDPARIGLYGASYGGFMVLSCVTRLPELDWAAAAVINGMSNLVTLAEASPPTWRNHVLTIIGDPEADRDFLLSRSPVTYADEARTPMLIIQGVNDRRVPRHESDQIVDALRAHGVDVVYELISAEGHQMSRADNQIRVQTMASDFLADRVSIPQVFRLAKP